MVKCPCWFRDILFLIRKKGGRKRHQTYLIWCVVKYIFSVEVIAPTTAGIGDKWQWHSIHWEIQKSHAKILKNAVQKAYHGKALQFGYRSIGSTFLGHLYNVRSNIFLTSKTKYRPYSWLFYGFEIQIVSYKLFFYKKQNLTCSAALNNLVQVFFKY